MSKKWAINDGAPYKQKDAPIIGAALEAIETERGIVTPTAVVEVARNKKNPLHQFFDWDNESASDKWRLHQARNLIGSVRVVIESDAGPVSGKAYYHIRTEDEGDNARNYMNTDNIMSHEELKARLIQQALDEGERWMERYKSIKELAGIFDAIRLAKKNVARKRRKVA